MGEATCLVTHKLTNDKANTSYPTKKYVSFYFHQGQLKIILLFLIHTKTYIPIPLPSLNKPFLLFSRSPFKRS